MSVRPAYQTVARNLNGVGNFVLQCKKVTFRYCNWGGSSEGMRQYLDKNLQKIAAQNPEIEFVAVKDIGHPFIRGEFVNGAEKTICCKNKHPRFIDGKFEMLKSTDGAPRKQMKSPVESINESVRGIWSPYHTNPEGRHKI
ncbi:54S ribosomal protein L51 [Yarrowia sp. C11]|nr:54S ribosomal protein L51 [Yarrowia sp. E02]KAG5372124.1 54S ribosomal protein L51 [Yarrowia sp. C11]